MKATYDETSNVIRRLDSEDVDVFRRIRIEALRAQPAAFASTVEEWERLSVEEWRRRLTDIAVYVAFRQGVPVGIMGLMRQQASKMAHRATVIMVYVREAERGLGVATDLMKLLAAEARLAGIRQLELAVSVENPSAIRFYQREDFAEIGRIPGAIAHDGRDIDEILMARRIDTP
jgi:ribosomal protein S18 acetylase RimI-like enzyme